MVTLRFSKVIDLTHELTADNPTWDGGCGFELTTTCEYLPEEAETQFKLQSMFLKKTGTGTHIDSPVHCFRGKQSVAQLSLEKLCTQAYVIDVSKQASADYIVTADDIKTFESTFEPIKKDSLVIIYTGWDQYWDAPIKYRNENDHGIMHFPSISKNAAELLIERDVAGIAIDTLSPDLPESTFPVHNLFLKNGKYIIENIANAGQLPPTNSFVIALPLKINATEAPIRIIGLISDESCTVSHIPNA